MGGKRTLSKPKSKMKRRTKFTILAIFNLTWCAVAVLVLSANDKVVPDSLTVAWFGAWTAELALLYGIKVKSPKETSDEVPMG